MSMVEVLEQTNTKVDLDNGWELILYNDDVNTFEHVVRQLMQICQHPKSMAVHLAVSTHENGREVVDFGDKELLLTRKELLEKAHLTVELQQV